jgi:ABC-type branched-subunit amino acid transport system substrate-binding protein
VREAAGLLRAQGGLQVSPAMMEGFAAAKVLVEGLRRAGAKPTRESLVGALNSMSKVDIGGMEINFSKASHTGLTYSDLSIIGQDGKFQR